MFPVVALGSSAIAVACTNYISARSIILTVVALVVAVAVVVASALRSHIAAVVVAAAGHYVAPDSTLFGTNYIFPCCIVSASLVRLLSRCPAATFHCFLKAAVVAGVDVVLLLLLLVHPSFVLLVLVVSFLVLLLLV